MKLDAVGACSEAGLDAGVWGGEVFEGLGHEAAVSAAVVDGCAGAIDIGHERTVGGGAEFAEGEADAVFVAGIAAGDDAEAQEFFEARTG